VSLTAKDVAEITRLLEASHFDELYLELDGLKLSLSRGSPANAHPLLQSAPAVPGTAAAATPVDPVPSDPDTQDVPSPLLGIFYRAPRPGAAPFVENGSAVEEDTIVGIIEVMKLMNTVRAGVRGKIIQILIEDGAMVEYGETLMRVSRVS